MEISLLKITGKYLDQPMLTAKFAKATPAILCAGSALVTAINTYQAPRRDQKKVFCQNVCIMFGTIVSAMVAAKGIKPVKINGKQIFKGFKGLLEPSCQKEIKKQQTQIIDEFVKNNPQNEKIAPILEKSKNNVLNHSEIATLYENLNETKKGQNFLEKFIPDPKKIKAKDIFSEIGKLSLMGLAPILGGTFGGIVGDRLTEKKWKEKIPNKIKEGAYQYFANIFLCNVGAAAALGIMEKMNIKSKASRTIGMTAGILIAGVAGGSAIANFIGHKFIDPIFTKKNNNRRLYSERSPEAVDLGLHIDDVATIAVISGLNWIKPALPVFYSFSGYRTGIGYRNRGRKNQRSV